MCFGVILRSECTIFFMFSGIGVKFANVGTAPPFNIPNSIKVWLISIFDFYFILEAKTACFFKKKKKSDHEPEQKLPIFPKHLNL